MRAGAGECYMLAGINASSGVYMRVGVRARETWCVWWWWCVWPSSLAWMERAGMFGWVLARATTANKLRLQNNC